MENPQTQLEILEGASRSVRQTDFRGVRQAFDQIASFLALMLLAPVLVTIGAFIFLESGWPVLFRQIRIGRNGERFQLLKFRTMRKGKSGPSLTIGGDARITVIGQILRKFKVDELPQLWNVVRGEMSLVGPRPEVPEFVDMSNPVWRSVLRVRPGITDPASIAYRNEGELLATVSEPVEFYRNSLLPTKLALNLEYLKKQSFWLDMKVILETVRCAMFCDSSEGKKSAKLSRREIK